MYYIATGGGLQVDIAVLKMEKPVNEHCRDVTELVKNIVLGFCKINVQYAERLDIYGSVHIRADNCDIANFILNEHCCNNSRASSPTVTSAQTVAVESEENDDNLQGQQNVQIHAVKTEIATSLSAETEKNQVAAADVPLWHRPDGESTMTQRQWNSLSQHSDSIAQRTVACSDNSASHSVGADSKHSTVMEIAGHVKSEAAFNNDQCSTDGIIEISDDDPVSCPQYTDYDNTCNESGEFKPELFSGSEQYDTEMSYEYNDNSFLQYDDTSAATYQYASAANNYFSKQAGVATSTKRRRPNCASAASWNAPSTTEKCCIYCQESFASKAELSAHYQQYHQCPVPEAGSVKLKQKTHSYRVDVAPGGNVPGNGSLGESIVQLYRCRYCPKMLRTADGLRNHENASHNGSKRYRCSFCSEEFLTRQASYTHRVKFHRLMVRKMQ